MLTGCEVVASEIAKYSEWDKKIMLAIARAENETCQPTNHNESSSETHRRADGSVVCVGSYNVLQVGCVHYNGEDPDDLSENVRIAYSVWQKQGYNAWTQYTNNKYLRFMK